MQTDPRGVAVDENNDGAMGMFHGGAALSSCWAGQVPQETIREKNQALFQIIISNLRSRTTWLCKRTYLCETLGFLLESSKCDFSSVKWAQYLPHGPSLGRCSVNGRPPQMTSTHPGQELPCAPGLQCVSTSLCC